METGRKGRAGERVTLKVRREGRPDEHAHHPDRPHRLHPHAVPARRAEHRRDRAGDGARRAHARQQPRGGGGRGRAREPARAAGLGRAARRRARVAQPSEVRCRRRPRALHHSAPAAEAGRHADQSALADRLPDARAVLGEDQGLRPHHLRPLPAPRHPAAALLREHRPLRGARRRAAGGRRRRLRRPDQPVAHAARDRAAGDADGPAARDAVQGQALRRRRQASRHARACRAPRARTRPGAAGSARSTCNPSRGRVAHERRRRPAAARARPARTRAASRCCSPTRPGCGRAATMAAGRTPICCAGSRTG